jgi:hypothetical protein
MQRGPRKPGVSWPAVQSATARSDVRCQFRRATRLRQAVPDAERVVLPRGLPVRQRCVPDGPRAAAEGIHDAEPVQRAMQIDGRQAKDGQRSGGHERSTSHECSKADSDRQPSKTAAGRAWRVLRRRPSTAPRRSRGTEQEVSSATIRGSSGRSLRQDGNPARASIRNYVAWACVEPSPASAAESAASAVTDGFRSAAPSAPRLLHVDARVLASGLDWPLGVCQNRGMACRAS